MLECGEVNATSTAAEADAYGRLFIDDRKSKWRLINTGIIDRFESLRGREPLTHQGKRLLYPCLPETARINETRRKLYDSPKIIFAKMASACEAFPDLTGQYASVNTNCFYSPRNGQDLRFFAAIFNSTAFTFLYDLYFGALRMAGGYFQWGSPQLRLIPIPKATANQQSQLSSLVDWLLWLRTLPTVLDSASQNPRDLLIFTYFDQWASAMVYELYFPDELHKASLRFFDLAAEAALPLLRQIDEAERLQQLRAHFESLYRVEHPLRRSLFALGSLPVVRIIEPQT